MRIIVAGGSGFLGQALVERLRAEHEVTVLTRHVRGAGQLAWTPEDADGAWVKAVQQADAVVNLAGESIASGRWSDTRKTAIRSSRVAATRALVTAIRSAATPPVLVSASAIGFYGDRRDELLTEGSPAGSDFLASVCQEWEAEANRAADRTRVVLLRTGLVLDRDGGALPQLAVPFKMFVGGRSGSGRQYWSWIHREDWVEMTRWAITTSPVTGPLNVTAPHPETNADLARALGRALHRPALLPTPAIALRLALGEMADALVLCGQRVLPAKAHALGFRFRYETLDAALAAIYS